MILSCRRDVINNEPFFNFKIDNLGKMSFLAREWTRNEIYQLLYSTAAHSEFIFLNIADSPSLSQQA